MKKKINNAKHYNSLKFIARDFVGSFIKKKNYRGNILSFRLNFPMALCINVHSFCNHLCLMCPYKDLRSIQKNGSMDFNLYKKILDEFSKNGGRILTFNNFSEIFAHKDGIKYFLIATEYKNLKIYLVTNGSNLSSKIIDKIIKSGFNGFVYISCHGFSKKTFKSVAGVDHFEKVKQNIIAFIKRYQRTERIIIQYIKNFSNDQEIKRAKKFWEDLGVTFNAFNSHSFCEGNFRNKHEGGRVALLGCNAWGHDAGLPFYQMVIQFDGSVNLCCMDVAQRVYLGNVKKNTIQDVWNSNRFKKIIELIYSGKTYSDSSFICNRCSSALYEDGLEKASFYNIIFAKAVNYFSKLI